MDIGRLWRTVRWLRPQQVAGRITFRLFVPSPRDGAPPPLGQRPGQWVLPAMRSRSMPGPERFRFLAVEHELQQCGWDSPGIEKLWRYNLHYFDDLNAIDAQARRPWHDALVARWVQDNPPARGSGWEPYPTSLRMVNWSKWIFGGATPTPVMLRSLAVQARWLEKRIENHLLGNHLFVNAKALMFAGLLFDGEEAARWLRTGLRILQQELPEQILADGGQFELSPMYHALALEDLLDLSNLLRLHGHDAPLCERLQATAGAMLHWLRCMTHPDGTLGRFNDTADDIAPANSELERYAAALGVEAQQPAGQGTTQLPDSGYLRLARDAAVLLLDVARIGPDYLPAHAHADTLSFELSLHGRRLIVNCGTSCYGNSAQRQRERGTAAHSTVQVGNIDSSEVWGGFRVGRRARPELLKVADGQVEAAHDGYAWLPGKPRHRRSLSLDAAGLTVRDAIESSAANSAIAPAIARFILAPGVTLEPLSSARWRIMLEQRPLGIVEIVQGSAALAGSTWSPAFGVTQAVACLEVSLRDGRSEVAWRWNDVR